MKFIMVTFPRSGHHALVNAVATIAGDALKYCEFYTHCNIVGCRDYCNMQKNHDFDLKLQIPEGWNVIVQKRREPICAIQSWFSLDVKGGVVEDSRESWLRFKEEKMDFYERWNNKWKGERTIYYRDFLLDIRKIAFDVCLDIVGVVSMANWDDVIDKMTRLQIYRKHLPENFKYA